MKERLERITLRYDLLDRRFSAAVDEVRRCDREIEPTTEFSVRLSGTMRRESAECVKEGQAGLTRAKALIPKGEEDQAVAQTLLDVVADRVERLDSLVGGWQRVLPMLSSTLKGQLCVLHRGAIAYRDHLELMFRQFAADGVDVTDQLEQVQKLENAFVAYDPARNREPLEVLAALCVQIALLNRLALVVISRAHVGGRVVHFRALTVLVEHEVVRERLHAEKPPVVLEHHADSMRICWRAVSRLCEAMGSHLDEACDMLVNVRDACIYPNADPQKVLARVSTMEALLVRVEHIVLSVTGAVCSEESAAAEGEPSS